MKMKRVFSVIVVLAMLIAAMGVAPVQAEEAGYTAKLMMISENWWPDAASAETVQITGDGTYTLKWYPQSWEGISKMWVFLVDILGAKDQVAGVSDVTVTADGVEIPVDQSKIATGDLEGNGNFRIELYNLYGPTPDNGAVDPAITVASELTVTFTVDMVDEEAPEESVPEESVPEESVPEESVPEESVPEESVPEESVPEESVPEESVPEESVPEESVPEESVPEESVPEESVPEESVPEESVPEESVPEESAPEGGEEDRLVYNSNASLFYADADWWPSMTTGRVTTSVTGAGTYTVTWIPTEEESYGSEISGAMVLCVDLLGAQDALSKDGLTYKLESISMRADDKSIAVDVSKVGTGDLEGNGNYRIELYNEYGSTKDAFDRSQLVFTEKLSISFRLVIVDASTGEVVDDSNPQTGDLLLPVTVCVLLTSALAMGALISQRKKWAV